MKQIIRSFEYQLLDDCIRQYIDLMYALDRDDIVEQLCANLIGETVVVVGYPDPERLYVYREVLVEKVENSNLYGKSDNEKIKLHIPYNYIYHPSILAALKCLL